MRILFLNDTLTILLCFIIWPILQLVAMKITFVIPDSYYREDNFLFKERKWENRGRIYERVFKIKKWKKLLPDGAAFVKQAYEKKNLKDNSKANLEKFLMETARAELTHILGMLPFWLFGLIAPPKVIIYMFVYAVVANVPCILLQRYNRIRLKRVLKRF